MVSRRPVDPFDRRSMAWSAILHVAVLAIGWMSTLYAPESMEFVAYQIELVSPPPAVQAEEPTPAAEEFVVERPDPDPAPPEPEIEEIIPVEDPEPEPEPEPEPREEPPEEEQPPEAADDPVVAASEDPVEEEPEESGEDLNVRIEGLKRDYPAYYNNIILQIERCFRWRDGGNWETGVFFYIDRDGGVEDIDIYSTSGNTIFDLRAMQAVECAGSRDRLGPLPEDLPYERFPVLFRFAPSGDPIAIFPQSGKPAEVTFER